MKVTVAQSSGFCFGVKNAVKAAEEAVKNPPLGKSLVMLGDIVHNTMVVDSLKKGGFTVVENASDVPEGAFVLIRAHGITPEEKEILEKRGCEIKDCTCPFVSKIHKIVREHALEGKNIIVTGGKGSNEPCTEAEAMAEWLADAGISPDRIILETRAVNTNQNIRYAEELMEEGSSVGIVTNDFHMFRALCIARKQGLDQAEGISAGSTPSFIPNNVLRECLGIGKDFAAGNL